jgi:hypothetical protein
MSTPNLPNKPLVPTRTAKRRCSRHSGGVDMTSAVKSDDELIEAILCYAMGVEGVCCERRSQHSRR